MTPQRREKKAELEGNTLGKKHQHYNKLVNEVLKSNEVLPFVKSLDDDIHNLIKIDVACRTKDVAYILEVLRSEDQLYVSKAIKRSTWLITEPQYAHIIHPEYLYTELYPNMTLKAFNKLMLNVRLHLKDEKRVEAFYEYFKQKHVKLAHKWLNNCSVLFVEEEVKNIKENPMDDIDITVLRRLFRKSFTVFESHVRRLGYCIHDEKDLDSMVKIYPLQVLDFLDCRKDPWNPFHYSFGPKATKILMKNYPERILNNIGIYGKHLHAETFARYLKNIEDVEEFLLKHVKYKNLDWLYANDKIQHFINQMPRQKRYEHVRKVFIEKDDDDYDDTEDIPSHHKNITARDEKSCLRQVHNSYKYLWYKFAPFEIAFTELSILIRSEPRPRLRNSMLQLLLSRALHDTNHTKTVLQYYHDRHFNESFKFKIQFVNFFISNVNTHSLDNQSWKLLCKLFHSMEVFIESENNVQPCIKAIIIRHAIREKPVPEIIEKKFVFDTFKTLQNKLRKPEEKEAVFKYLQEFIVTKSNALQLIEEHDFDEAVTLCEHLFLLIKDWGKELHHHPYALAKVKELIKIRNKKQWSRNLAAIYNINKFWRRQMFEESIVMMQNGAVCMNALKHDPGLLSRYQDQILRICCNDVSLRSMLRKIRIYWPQTLAEDWKITYLNSLKNVKFQTHNDIIENLCFLFSQQEIIYFLNKHAPSDMQINRSETDQLNISVSKHIAKNIHKARPLPPLEGILQYVKEDYLQHAMLSLNAVLNQKSPNRSRIYIAKMLDAPLSLKKIGLRWAICKLKSVELVPMMTEIWNITRSISIRTVIFSKTFELLCKGNNTSSIMEIWCLLSMFIDKLTCNDSMTVFNKLGQYNRLPANIQPQFYIKSFAFINSLPAKCKCESIYKKMQDNAINYVEYFDDEFVVKILLNYFRTLFDEKNNIYVNMERLISAYILVSKDEDTQIRRYDNTLNVLLEQYLPQWENVQQTKDCLKRILGELVSAMEKYTFEKNMTIPLKVFQKILAKLENNLSIQKHYVFITMWKLATAFVEVLNENRQILNDIERKPHTIMNEEEKQAMLDEIHATIAIPFAKLCVQHLKKDVNRFGHSIYLLLGESLKLLLHCYLPGTMYEVKLCLVYLKSLLQCGTECELYLMVCHHIFFIDIGNSYHIDDIEMKLCKEIYDMVMSHSSNEVKILISNVFNDIVLPLYIRDKII